jgi:hypothetical protein
MTQLSHGFSIFENKEKETGVNFPIGLVKVGDEILISFGESDYKTIIVKMNMSEVNRLLNLSDITQIQLLSYNKENNLVCYKDDTENRKYYLKYLKYKNKYLELRNKF